MSWRTSPDGVAMVGAATYQGSGFFTPMYHIASTFIDPKPMMTSMERAAQDQLFYFEFGRALLGMMIHLRPEPSTA